MVSLEAKLQKLVDLKKKRNSTTEQILETEKEIQEILKKYDMAFQPTQTHIQPRPVFPITNGTGTYSATYSF